MCIQNGMSRWSAAAALVEWVLESIQAVAGGGAKKHQTCGWPQYDHPVGEHHPRSDTGDWGDSSVARPMQTGRTIPQHLVTVLSSMSDPFIPHREEGYLGPP